MSDTQTKNVIVRLKMEADESVAKHFKSVEEHADKAGHGVNRLKEHFEKLKNPVRVTNLAVADMYQKMQKDSAQAQYKVEQLAASFKKLGLSLADVKKMAADMGKQFHLSMNQIEEAAKKAQLPGTGPVQKEGGGIGGRLEMMAMMLRGGATSLGLYAGHEALNRGAEFYASNQQELSRAYAMQRHPERFSEEQLMATPNAPAANAHPHAMVAGFFQRILHPIGRKIGEGMYAKEFAEADEVKRGMMLKAARAMKREEEAEQEIGIKRPFEEGERTAQEQMAAMRDRHSAQSLTHALAYAYSAKQGAFGESLGEMQRKLGGKFFEGTGGAAAINRIQEQSEIFKLVGLGQGERLGEARGGVDTARAGSERATARRVAAEKEVADATREAKSTQAEMVFLKERARTLADEEVAAARHLVDAKHDEAKTQKEILSQQREMVHSVLSQARAQRAAEEGKLAGFREHFGAMTPTQRTALGRIIDKAKNGPGQGRPDRIQFVGGRPVRIPGTSGKLTPDELGQLQSGAPDIAGEYLRKQAQHAGVEGFIQQHGLNERLEQARAVEKRLNDVNIRMSNDVKVSVEANLKDIAQVVADKVDPAIKHAVEALRAEMLQKLEQNALLRARSALLAIGGAGG